MEVGEKVNVFETGLSLSEKREEKRRQTKRKEQNLKKGKSNSNEMGQGFNEASIGWKRAESVLLLVYVLRYTSSVVLICP